DMGDQLDVVAELDTFTHDAIGPDLDVRADLGLAVDDRARVDDRHQPSSMIMAVKVASATWVSSTLASASNFQTERRRCFLRMNTLSWSPGTTGRRKRAFSTDMK